MNRFFTSLVAQVFLLVGLTFPTVGLGAESLNLVSAGSANDKRLLRYELNVGAEQTVKTITQVRVENPAMAQPMVQEHSTQLKATVKSKRQDGSWRIETLTTADLFRQFPGLDGLRSKLNMTPEGDLKVLNMPEQISKLSKAMGSDNEQAKQLIESMSGTSSNQALMLPKVAVGTGAVWTSKTTSSMGQFGDVVLDSRYEIKKISGDLVEIAFVGKMEFGDLLSKVTGNNPVKMRLTKAEITGTYAVHLKRPQVIGTMHSLMTMEIDLPGGKGGTMNMTTTVSMREVKP